MAEVFLLKDGTPTDHRATPPLHVAIERLVEKLTPFEKQFHLNPPDINPAGGPAAPSDPYRHVVVKIHERDVNGIFPEAGYYYIPHLTAEDAANLFGLRFGE